jgi:hypothetical protein
MELRVDRGRGEFYNDRNDIHYLLYCCSIATTDVGVKKIKIEVDDDYAGGSHCRLISKTFDLAVQPFDCGAVQLKATPASGVLPSGTAGVAGYSTAFSTAASINATAPITMSKASGTVPPGLSFIAGPALAWHSDQSGLFLASPLT